MIQLTKSSVPASGHPRISRKLRGGYYTPGLIGEFLASWAVRNRSDRVLEPSCGDGALVEPVAKRLTSDGEVVAVELFEEEAIKARARNGANATFVIGDVFTWWDSREHEASFDAVVGNPPFIRYQDFPDEFRSPAFQHMREEGMNPTRLANAWLPFVVLATRSLRRGGRLALVLPAELMQVGYAAELRQYLTRKFSELHIITFRKMVFEGIQQEVILVLGVRQDCTSAQINVIELNTASDLSNLDLDEGRSVEINLEHASEKWTQYYLSQREIGLLRALASDNAIPRLNIYGDVNVGIVTGRNSFFVLTKEEASRLGVLQWCIPLVGRSFQIPGLILSQSDWNALYNANKKVLLLNVEIRNRRDLPPQVLNYVVKGEQLGYHQGYKCSIRLPAWWRVPSRWVPEAFMLRQIYDAPRIVANEATAMCTDTIHRVRLKPGVSATQVAAASVNSMTFAFAEIMGRSYGGGVLELEPREAINLPFPKLNGELPTFELDRLTRKSTIEETSTIVDGLVLEPLGLSREEVALLRDIWRTLSSRRRNRSRR